MRMKANILSQHQKSPNSQKKKNNKKETFSKTS